MARLLALLLGTCLLSGCVSVQTAGGRVTYWVLPGLESGDQTNRAGTTYYNQRWGTSPDTHPAVAARPGQVVHAAMDGPENGSGSASQPGSPGEGMVRGDLRVRPVDPCRSDWNEGTFWGALAGGWLGSLFGGGHGRELFTALGLWGGAVRGTEMVNARPGCR